jgi:hypothetical protein
MAGFSVLVTILVGLLALLRRRLDTRWLAGVGALGLATVHAIQDERAAHAEHEGLGPEPRRMQAIVAPSLAAEATVTTQGRGVSRAWDAASSGLVLMNSISGITALYDSSSHLVRGVVKNSPRKMWRSASRLVMRTFVQMACCPS